MKILDIDCIVLAAGLSSRMGEPKQLIHIEGKTILQHSLDLTRACCHRVIIVQGAVDLSDQVPSDKNIILTDSPNYRAGQIESLKAGILAVQSPLFFVMLADLIWVRPETFGNLACSIGHHHAAYPVCQGRRGHPVLMDKEAAALIQKATPKQKAMQVIGPLNPVAVPVDDTGIYNDIDTKEDLQKNAGQIR